MEKVDIQALADEYMELRKTKASIEKRMKELGNYMKEFAIENGTKSSTGSSYCDLDNYVVGNQAKKSVKLNEVKAKDYLLALGLYEKVVETKEYINEEKLEQLMAEGELLPEDLEAMVDIKITYALDIKAVETSEEMPEVQTENSKKVVKKLPKKLKK